MSEVVKYPALSPGMRVVLVDGAVAEIVSNPGDGFGCLLAILIHPPISGASATNMIFAQDVAAVRPPG